MQSLLKTHTPHTRTGEKEVAWFEDESIKRTTTENKEKRKEMKITENTTQFTLNVSERYGKRRVYIEKIGVLGKDLYFDVNEGAVFVCCTKKRARSWTVTKENDDTWRVESNTTRTYFTVQI